MIHVKRKKRNIRNMKKGNKCKLTVIARHRKLGEGALNRLKNEVQAYAIDHTYKETARKFGIHHSTVSGWIKKSSLTKDHIASCTISTDMFPKPGESHHGPIKVQNDENEQTISSKCGTLTAEHALQSCSQNNCGNQVKNITTLKRLK